MFKNWLESIPEEWKLEFANSSVTLTPQAVALLNVKATFPEMSWSDAIGVVESMDGL